MNACKGGTCENLFFVTTDEELVELAKLKGVNASKIKNYRFAYNCRATPKCRAIGHLSNWSGYTTPSWCPLKGIEAADETDEAANADFTDEAGENDETDEPDADAPELPTPPEIVMISTDKLLPSLDNFYSMTEIDELAASIALFGVKQPILVKELMNGDFEVISGHRRLAACQKLASDGENQFKDVPCIIERGENADDGLRRKLLLIMSNSTARKMTDWEKTRQAAELKAIFTKLKETENLPGRVRDMVANAMHVARTQIGQMEIIDKNLIPEFKEKFKGEQIGISAAYEIAGMSEDEQTAALDELSENENITMADAANVKRQVQNKTESRDTERPAKKDKPDGGAEQMKIDEPEDVSEGEDEPEDEDDGATVDVSEDEGDGAMVDAESEVEDESEDTDADESEARNGEVPLKVCPFCGFNAQKHAPKTLQKEKKWIVKCMVCGATMDDFTEWFAVHKWNRRV